MPRSAPSRKTSNSQNSPCVVAPSMPPTESTSDTSMIQSASERFRMKWEEVMGHPSKPVRHKNVAVLLLSWDPELDDLGVRDEVRSNEMNFLAQADFVQVDALETVFEHKYGFTVYNEKLGTKRRHEKCGIRDGKPDVQALHHLSKLANEEDDPNSLLIVYYAGHGSGGRGVNHDDLQLAGNRHSPPAQSSCQAQVDRNQFLWSFVEVAVKKLEGDLLLIFDCCYAGRLVSNRDHGRPGNYQILGSCSDTEMTRSTGPGTFTKALIAALDTLAKSDKAFNTSKLRSMIMQHPDFPNDDQVPVLSNRLRAGEHIVIDRRGLPDITCAPNAHPNSVETEYIDIRIHFSCPVVETHIEDAATHLKEVRDRHKDEMTHIDFLGKSSKLEKFARKLITTRRARSSSVLASPSLCDLDSPHDPGIGDSVLHLSPTEQVKSMPTVMIGNADQVIVGHVNHDSTLLHHLVCIVGILHHKMSKLHHWIKIRV